MYLKQSSKKENLVGNLLKQQISIINDLGILFIEGELNLSVGTWIVLGQVGILCNRVGTLLSHEISISLDNEKINEKNCSKSINTSMKKGDVICMNIQNVITVKENENKNVCLLCNLRYSTGDFITSSNYFNLTAYKI